jgi:hypothetical protein
MSSRVGDIRLSPGEPGSDARGVLYGLFSHYSPPNISHNVQWKKASSWGIVHISILALHPVSYSSNRRSSLRSPPRERQPMPYPGHPEPHWPLASPLPADRRPKHRTTSPHFAAELHHATFILLRWAIIVPCPFSCRSSGTATASPSRI